MHKPPIEWFIHSLKCINGVSYDELIAKNEVEAAEAWKGIEAAFDDLAAHFDKAGEGNFRVTGGVSYAEFELVTLLESFRRAHLEVWKRLGARNGGRWGKLLDLPL